MNTLIQQNIQQSEDLPDLPCAGREPRITASDIATGVSVSRVTNTEYTANPEYQWYAMIATYDRARRAAEYLSQHGVLVFYPTKKQEIIRRNKSKRTSTTTKETSFIPNTLFVYTDLQTAESFVRYNRSSKLHIDYLHFMYDKTLRDIKGNNPPLTIAKKQMDNFINLLSKDVEGTELVSNANIRFKSGDEVEITGGQFKGIKGRIARIKGTTRIVVALTGVCYAATTYIPKEYIKLIEK